MKPWLHKLEIITDKSIPWLVLLLLGVIVAELGFHERAAPYRAYLDTIDYVVIAVFVVDLAFKYNRVRRVPKFIRLYWLDILVVFPFFLVFRLIENFLVLLLSTETIVETQRIAHVGVEIEKETSKLIREAENVGKVSRSRAILLLSERVPQLRAILRAPRLLKILPFYEKPRHHNQFLNIAKPSKRSKQRKRSYR